VNCETRTGEAQREKTRGLQGHEWSGVLGDDAVSSIPTIYVVWGSAVNSLSGVWGTAAPAAERFSCILEAPNVLI